MGNAKKIVSLLLAVLMIASVFSCLASAAVAVQVVGPSDIYTNTTVSGTIEAKNYSDIVAKKLTTTKAYGDDPTDVMWSYVALEFYEEDDEGEFTVLTDHLVEPGQKLLVKMYAKTSFVAGAALFRTMFERNIFDITNGTRKGDAAFMTATTNTSAKPTDSYPTGGYPATLKNLSTPDSDVDGTATSMQMTLMPAAFKTAELKTDAVAATYYGTGVKAAQVAEYDTAVLQVIQADSAATATNWSKDVAIYEFEVTVNEDAAVNTIGRAFIDGNASIGVASKGLNYIKTAYTPTQSESEANAQKIQQGNVQTSNNCKVAYADISANVIDCSDAYHVFKVVGDTTGYTATFDANGGEAVTAQTEVTEVTLPSTTKTGHQLTGWSDGTNTYTVGTKVTLTADTTFTAVWSANSQTVTFDGEGGDVSYGSTVEWPEDPTPQTGYKFDGWKLGTTTYKTTDSVTVTGDMAFTSVFSKKSYTINWFLPGSTKADLVETKEYGDTITAPTKFNDTTTTYVWENDATCGDYAGGSVSWTATAVETEFKVTYKFVNPITSEEVDVEMFAHAGDAIPACDETKIPDWDHVTINADQPAYNGGQMVIEVPDNDNTVVTAVVEAIKFTLGVNYGLDESYIEEDIVEGTSITKDYLATLTNNACDVANYNTSWYYDEQFKNEVTFPFELNEATELYAKYTEKDAEVTINVYLENANDDNYAYSSANSTVSTEFKAGSTATFTASNLPSITNYSLNTTKSTLSVSVTESGASVDVYYDLNEANVVINYQLEGESTTHAISTTAYKIGQTIVWPATSEYPTVTGYTCDGYTTTTPVVCGTNGGTYTLSYLKNTYYVKFWSDTTNVDTITLKYGDSLEDIDLATKTTTAPVGHEFSYWYTTSANTPATLPDTIGAADINLYAKFSPLTYTIYVKCVDDTKSVMLKDYAKYADVVYGEATSLPAVKDFEAFTGFTAESADSIQSTMPAQDLYVTLHYSRNSYIANFVVDGLTTPVNTYYGDIPSISTPTKKGYTFDAWTPVPAAMTTEGAEYTATWNVNSYTATFDANGGKFDTLDSIDVTDVEFGTAATFTQVPTLDNYEFVGFCYANDTKETVLDASAYIMNEEGVTFKAVWKQDTNAMYVKYMERVTTDYFQTGKATYVAVVNGDFEKIRIVAIDENGAEIEGLTKTYGKTSIAAEGKVGLNSVTAIEAGDALLAKEGVTVGMYKWTFTSYLSDGDFKAQAKINTLDWEGFDAAYTFTNKFDEKAPAKVEEDIFSVSISANEVLRGKSLTWTFKTATDVAWIKLTGLVNGEEKSTWYKAGETYSADADNVRTWTIPMVFNFNTTTGATSDSQAWTAEYCKDGSTTFTKITEDVGGVVTAKTFTVVVNKYAKAPTGTDTDFTIKSATAANVGYKKTGTITVTTGKDVTKLMIGCGTKANTYQETSTKAQVVDGAGNTKIWTITYTFSVKTAGTDGYYVKARGTAWGDATALNINVE